MSNKIILFTKDKVISVFFRNLLYKIGYDDLQVTFNFSELKYKLQNDPCLVIINKSDLSDEDIIKLSNISKEKNHLPIVFIKSFNDETSFDDEIIKPYGYIVSPFEKKELESTLKTVMHISTIEKKIIDQKKTISKALKDMNIIFNTTDSALLVIEKGENIIRKVNNSFFEIFNIDNKNIVGEPIDKIFDKLNIENVIEEISIEKDREKTLVIENGSKYFEMDFFPFDGNLKDEEFLLKIDDVTDYKNKEKELYELSHFDSMTGAPNRYYILKKIDNLINQKIPFHLYYFDIDDFKEVNEILGHFTGDMLIKKIYNRLKEFNSEKIFTGRVMGDEFVVIIKNENNNILKITNSIRDKLIEEYNVLEQKIFISLTGAIVKYPEDGEALLTLLKHSNISLTEAKRKHKRKNIIFKEKMKKNLKNRINKTQNIKNALKNNEFELFFQPQINYLDKKVYGYEGLIRWKKDNNYIAPDEFIPFAEENGLIIDIGKWVIENSFKNLKYFDNKKLSVNISPLEFRNYDFINILKFYSEKYNINNSLITIEITEGALFETDRFNEKINEIKSMGFKISLDDFGTGYSSLSYLAELPIDELKVDKSFILKLFNNKKNQTVVNSVIELSKNLDFDLVSEGIETQEQIDYLLERGCLNFQGYFFSKPLHIEKVKGFDINI